MGKFDGYVIRRIQSPGMKFPLWEINRPSPHNMLITADNDVMQNGQCYVRFDWVDIFPEPIKFCVLTRKKIRNWE